MSAFIKYDEVPPIVAKFHSLCDKMATFDLKGQAGDAFHTIVCVSRNQRRLDLIFRHAAILQQALTYFEAEFPIIMGFYKAQLNIIKNSITEEIKS